MNQLKKAVVSIIKQMSLGGLALAILAWWAVRPGWLVGKLGWQA